MSPSTQPSYFDQLIRRAGSHPEQITVPLQCPNFYEMKSRHDTKLFDEDDERNIRIIVFDVDRNVITHKHILQKTSTSTKA